MDKAERERLRKLCEELAPGSWRYEEHPHAASVEPNVLWLHTPEDGARSALRCLAALPALLNALEEAERDRDHYRGASELLVGAEEMRQKAEDKLSASEARVRALAQDVLLFVGDMDGAELRFDMHPRLRALRDSARAALAPPKETP